jgi:MYXO-CTERM domain-containing protein
MRRLLAIGLLCSVFVPAAALVHVGEASACSCMPPKGPVEAAQNVNVVFQAKLVAVADAPQPGPYDVPSTLFTFAVIRTFKGQLDARVTVLTADNSAACGRSYGEVDSEWLVYARVDDNGQLHDNLCSRTMRFEQAAADVAELEEHADALDDDPPPYEPIDEPGPADPEPEPIQPQPKPHGADAEPEPIAKAGRCSVTDGGGSSGALGLLGLFGLSLARRRRR